MGEWSVALKIVPLPMEVFLSICIVHREGWDVHGIFLKYNPTGSAEPVSHCTPLKCQSSMLECDCGVIRTCACVKMYRIACIGLIGLARWHIALQMLFTCRNSESLILFWSPVSLGHWAHSSRYSIVHVQAFRANLTGV